MSDPKPVDRLLLALAVILFGVGIIATSKGATGVACIEFIASGVSLAMSR